ncbi:MAG: hypothetical protein BJ554DRAFT_4033 [Olpidium bornovanus]|uniref:histidinol dehydrogenase n=1 Tax=Olpidium bornovanus TaxID=278681 RepID=A0A8H7ZNB6_9FUNG|nr:MAG: hypothetical protein BJ554DRAFT_4033 [Olpidium bornovanus]
MYSGVNTASFQKHITAQRLTRDGLDAIAEAVMTLAEVEGLEAHRNAVAVRLRDIRNDGFAAAPSYEDARDGGAARTKARLCHGFREAQPATPSTSPSAALRRRSASLPRRCHADARSNLARAKIIRAFPSPTHLNPGLRLSPHIRISPPNRIAKRAARAKPCASPAAAPGPQTHRRLFSLEARSSCRSGTLIFLGYPEAEGVTEFTGVKNLRVGYGHPTLVVTDARKLLRTPVTLRGAWKRLRAHPPTRRHSPPRFRSSPLSFFTTTTYHPPQTTGPGSRRHALTLFFFASLLSFVSQKEHHEFPVAWFENPGNFAGWNGGGCRHSRSENDKHEACHPRDLAAHAMPWFHSPAEFSYKQD